MTFALPLVGGDEIAFHSGMFAPGRQPEWAAAVPPLFAGRNIDVGGVWRGGARPVVLAMRCLLRFLLVLPLPYLASPKVLGAQLDSNSHRGSVGRPKHVATPQLKYYHSRFRYGWYGEDELAKFWRIHRTLISAD